MTSLQGTEQLNIHCPDSPLLECNISVTVVAMEMGPSPVHAGLIALSYQCLIVQNTTVKVEIQPFLLNVVEI